MVSDVRAVEASLRSELRAEIKAVRSELQAEIRTVRDELSERIKEEGETTRRHFNIMLEKIDAAVRIVADGTAHQTVVLDNHEARLKALEQPR